MIKPALFHVAIRQKNGPDPVRYDPVAARFDGVTVKTGAPSRKGGPHGLFCTSRIGAGARCKGAGGFRRSKIPRPPACHSAKADWPRRFGRTVVGPKIGDDLCCISMPKCPERPADPIEGKAVAHAALAFHIQGSEPRAIRGWRMAIPAGKAVSKTLFGPHGLRHARNAATLGKVKCMGKFEAIVVHRMGIVRDAPIEPAPLGVCANGHSRSKLWMVRSKIISIHQAGVWEP